MLTKKSDLPSNLYLKKKKKKKKKREQHRVLSTSTCDVCMESEEIPHFSMESEDILYVSMES
jgi:hypothetical protein